MKAATHTEVYRPFRGQLKRFPVRPWVLAWSGVRLGFKKKLPALLLFTPPAIAALVGCVTVHLRFTILAEAQKEGGTAIVIANALAEALGDVSQIIIDFISTVRFFALLAMAWYGAGLVAEDKRLGANLLYFSRPLSRLGYMSGKLLAALMYGACTLLAPTVLILAQASFSSPDWSFLQEEWDVALKAILYSLLWIFVMSSVVLALSSLVKRKTLALALVFGVIFIAGGVASVAHEITGDAAWELPSLIANFERLGEWLFDKPSEEYWNVEATFWVLGMIVTGSLAVFWNSVRKMEVVG